MLQAVVIDNVVPAVLADKIEGEMFSNHFPWYFLHDVASENAYTKSVGFSHWFYKEGGQNSEYCDTIMPILSNAVDRSKLKGNHEIIIARSFLQLPLLTEQEQNHIHVDLLYPHYVCLYYVTDADGDTCMYDKDFNITQRIEPKKNRAVIFDGLTFHSSTNPKNGKRAVINFNFFITE